jgi:hypothetical protein
MKTPEEYLKERLLMTDFISSSAYEAAIQAIETAQDEAIRAAAESAHDNANYSSESDILKLLKK